MPRRPHDQRLQQINRQAWDDVHAMVRELFAKRQRELLAAAGLDEAAPRRFDWPTRLRAGDRNRAFAEFVAARVKDGTLDRVDDDTWELIQVFLKKPSGHNRLVLYHNLKEVVQEEPELFGDYTRQFQRFG